MVGRVNKVAGTRHPGQTPKRTVAGITKGGMKTGAGALGKGKGALKQRVTRGRRLLGFITPRTGLGTVIEAAWRESRRVRS